MDAPLEAIPPVVPGFPSITVGGAFAGTAGESSSFWHGFFASAVTWIEIVIPNGSVEVASKNMNSDLLYSAVCSYGTLGIIILLKIELAEVKKYMQLTYWLIVGIDQALEKIDKVPHTNYVNGVLCQRFRPYLLGTFDRPRNRSGSVFQPSY